MDTAIKSGKFDLFAGIVSSDNCTNKNDIVLTNNFYHKASIAVVKRGNILSDFDISVVALPKTKQNLVEFVKKDYSNSKIIFCDNSQNCLNCVKNVTADISFLDSFVVNNLLQNHRFDIIVTIPSTYISEKISFGTPTQIDPTFPSALNKPIDCLDMPTVNKITMENLVKTSYQLAIYDAIYKYRIAIFIFVLGAIGFIFLVSALHKKRVDTILAKKEAEDFRTIAERDTLTGLYKKEPFYSKKHEMLIKTPYIQYTIICIDIERFEIVNYIFGIKAGDKLLIFVANILSCELPKEKASVQDLVPIR